MTEAIQGVFSNKMVVRRTGASHCVFRDDCVDSVWVYELVSCDVDPTLKSLTFEVGPIPPSCYSESVAEVLAQLPATQTKQLDDPSVCINDDVLDLMRFRGVEVEYLPND